MLVRMQLARIVIVDSENEKASMIVLREVDGDRAFPILIGINEAYAIDRRSKGQGLERPLTHDLLLGLIEGLGGKLERIVINELKDQTFYARLVIKLNGVVVSTVGDCELTEGQIGFQSEGAETHWKNIRIREK